MSINGIEMVFSKKKMLEIVEALGDESNLTEETLAIMDNLDGQEVTSASWSRQVKDQPVFSCKGKDGSIMDVPEDCCIPKSSFLDTDTALYAVVYDSVENGGIERSVVTLDSKDIELEKLYELTRCGIVGKISLTDTIDLWCDEEGSFNSENSITNFILEEGSLSIFGTCCLLAHEGSEVIPLNKQQVEWVEKNIQHQTVKRKG